MYLYIDFNLYFECRQHTRSCRLLTQTFPHIFALDTALHWTQHKIALYCRYCITQHCIALDIRQLGLHCIEHSTKLHCIANKTLLCSVHSTVRTALYWIELHCTPHNIYWTLYFSAPCIEFCNIFVTTRSAFQRHSLVCSVIWGQDDSIKLFTRHAQLFYFYAQLHIFGED